MPLDNPMSNGVQYTCANSTKQGQPGYSGFYRYLLDFIEQTQTENTLIFLFHGGNTGSIPVGRANKIKDLCLPMLIFEGDQIPLHPKLSPSS